MRATVPLKLFTGVRVRLKVAGCPLRTEAEALKELLTVRVKLPPRRPDPESKTTSGEVEAELVMVTVPLRVPVVDGVKVMVAEQLAPGARLVKVQGEVMLKSPVGVAKASLVMGAFPVLERLRVRTADEPMEMVPKLRVEGVI